MLDVGLRMLKLRHIVAENEGQFSVNEKDLHIVRYYANAIAHLLPGEAAAGEVVTPEITPLPASARALPAA
jgi:hypothetical protein